MLPSVSCFPRKPSTDELMTLYTSAAVLVNTRASEDGQTWRTEHAGRVADERPSTGDRVQDAVQPQPGVCHSKGPPRALAEAPDAADPEPWGAHVSIDL
jgi:hypothetical protein